MRQEMARQQWREYGLVALAFALSRLALVLAGLQFNFSLDWMWLSDPADLQHRLLQTIYYFHAFPPGMDLLSGILLKLGGTHAAALAQLTFWVCGLVLVSSLYYLARAADLSARVSFAVSLAFSLLPQVIYFEHLYLYEEPVAALLCLSVALFHAALSRQSWRLWFAFFAACAVIGVTRSTFHIAWFVVMVGAALSFNSLLPWRRVLMAASAPAALLLALYLKNLIVFGTFSAFTYGPSSYAHVTVSNLPAEVRAEWAREHKLSPFATLSPYAGPRDYLRVYSGAPGRDWPPQLTELERPTVGAPNFNHWVILEANRERSADAWYYLRTQPLEYASRALQGLRDFFTPSTEWHPYTGTERSPHYQHRSVLGGYETIVNRLAHGFPVSPVGLYVFLPVVLLWTARHAWRLSRRAGPGMRSRAAMLWLCVFNVIYITGISSAVTFLESSRYRYQAEALIWVMTALCVTTLGSPAIRWARRQTA
jgi:4-amino-4-deoxy-L-arabinose transferase-like glycosyltransferase